MISTTPDTKQMIPVMEHFYTIQGEGFHQGKAAYFIRLGGCDVGCVWCDVKDSWDAGMHPSYTIDQVVSMVETGTGDDREHLVVVITGGEPLMHNLDALTNALQAKGFHTNIETSGAHPLSGYWDWICLSPKKFKAPLPAVIEKASELKVVIFNKSDFAWAEKYAAQVSKECLLYLQPEWSRRDDMTPLIVDFIKSNPRWRVSIQVHKYMNVP